MRNHHWHVGWLSVALLAGLGGCRTPPPPAAPVVTERTGGWLPCETFPSQVLSRRCPDPLLVPRRDGGVTALMFHNQTPEGPVVALCDLTRGQVKRQKLPDGFANPWSQVWGPDGKLYFGLWGPATMLRYDPDADRLDTFGIMETDPSYKAVPRLTLGTDNQVYGIAAGYVFALDPATDAVTRYGHQGPRRSYPIAYKGSLAVDDDTIYSTFGNFPEETFTVAMRKATREWSHLDEIRGARFEQGPHGVTASLGTNRYWMVNGKPVRRTSPNEPPPWPLVDRPPRTPAPVLTDKPEWLTPTREEGQVVLRYRFGTNQAWCTLAYDMPAMPVDLSRIWVMPDNRLFASTFGYDGIWALDTTSGAATQVGWYPQSHYSTLVRDGKAYLAGYPGSTLYVWDPSRPWTIRPGPPGAAAPRENSPDSNPRALGRWEKNGNFQFPLRFVQSADGTFFSAIHGERENVGCVLSWRNEETGAGGFLRDPFELYDVVDLCAAFGGTKIVLSTFGVAGLRGEPKPTSGRLFVVDAATRQLDWFMDPLPGVDQAGFMVETEPGRLVLAANCRMQWPHTPGTNAPRSILYAVDLKKRRVTKRVELPGLLAGRRDYSWRMDFRLGPDGMIYTLYDDLLVRIHPKSFAVTTISQVGAPGLMAFVGQDLYLSGKPSLRRVRNAAAP